MHGYLDQDQRADDADRLTDRAGHAHPRFPDDFKHEHQPEQFDDQRERNPLPGLRHTDDQFGRDEFLMEVHGKHIDGRQRHADDER